MPELSLQHEIRKKKPFESAEQEAYLNLARTSAFLSAGFDRLFRPLGLSEATYNVLRILRGAGEGGRMCHEIAEHMVTRVPDVTRLVDRLERAGWAARDRCTKDRRVIHVKITPEGTRLLAGLDKPVLAMHEEQLGHMSKKELTDLSRALVRARHPDAGSAS